MSKENPSEPELEPIKTSREKDRTDYLKEIDRLKGLIQIADEKDRIAQEKAIQQERVIKLRNKEQVIDQMIKDIDYFKNTRPFKDNMSFLSALTDFYKKLTVYEALGECDVENSANISEHRSLLVSLQKSGTNALNIIGTKPFRYILKEFEERFSRYDKQFKDFNKKLNKVLKK